LLSIRRRRLDRVVRHVSVHRHALLPLSPDQRSPRPRSAFKLTEMVRALQFIGFASNFISRTVPVRLMLL
jgi:hypothetical protein